MYNLLLHKTIIILTKKMETYGWVKQTVFKLALYKNVQIAKILLLLLNLNQKW